MNWGNFDRRDFIAACSFSVASFIGHRSFAQSTEPSDLTIAQASKLIRSGDLSPVEIVGAYLTRIDRLDPQINAFITLTDQYAVTRARALEAELAAGNWRGPLHGIPIALKDNIDTEGVLTTAASAVFADRIPEKNAEIVDRLERAGAIILGKLNMHEFAYGGSSAITHYKPVHNPWDLDRITGGSSGGSGAAVAARLCAGALGTDTGGSVRIPAAHCGIVGLKATYGLASIRGIIPLGASFDHVGPMCRTVADAALMLQAMAGYDPLDFASIEAEIPRYSSAMERRTSELRIGIPRELFYEDVDPQILSAVSRAHEILSDLTTETEDVDVPALPDLPIVFSEAFAYHAPFLEAKRELYDPITLERILRGEDIATSDYVEAKYQLELVRNSIARVFENVDLLVTPTLPALPIRIADAVTSDADEGLIRNTMPFNIFGIPSISLPCGFSREGLPIGLQISGPALGELDVLALAHAYEQVTDWHERAPELT